MSVSRCQHCKLPLTEAEARADLCPACGGGLRPGAGPRPAARGPSSGAAVSWGVLWCWTGGLALLSLVVGGSWLLSAPGPDARERARPVSPVAVLARTEKRASVPKRPDVAPPPAGGKATAKPGHASEPAVKPNPGDEAPARAKLASPPAEVAGEPQPEPKGAKKQDLPGAVNDFVNKVNGAAARKGPPRVVEVRPAPLPPVYLAEREVLVDRPNGMYTVPALNRRMKLTLVGKVRTLLVGLVDGESCLDASELQARQILFTKKIDGGSVVKLNAPGGTVEFRAQVDGRSWLEVNAPGGTVTFSRPAGRGSVGSKIDGESEVAITARVVDFRSILNGTQTRVDVTLTRDGLLRFREIAGNVRLHYRKADPGDPEPRVEAGSVTGQAQLRKVE